MMKHIDQHYRRLRILAGDTDDLFTKREKTSSTPEEINKTTSVIAPPEQVLEAKYSQIRPNKKFSQAKKRRSGARPGSRPRSASLSELIQNSESDPSLPKFEMATAEGSSPVKRRPRRRSDSRPKLEHLPTLSENQGIEAKEKEEVKNMSTETQHSG